MFAMLSLIELLLIGIELVKSLLGAIQI